MLLVIDAVISETECPNHIRWVDDYETAFELLTQLTAEGWALQQVLLFDEGNPVRLPVEAFDGESLMEPIYELQQQWQQVLSGESDLAPETEITEGDVYLDKLDVYLDKLDVYLDKLINFYEREIDTQTHTVWRLHMAIERQQDSWYRSSMNDVTKRYCDDLLSRLVNYHARRLEQAKLNYQQVTKRLSFSHM